MYPAAWEVKRLDDWAMEIFARKQAPGRCRSLGASLAT